MTENKMKELIKSIGTGPKGSRGLSRDEAFEACQLILSGSATPAQIGGFLLALRTKGETSSEMEGFLLALQSFLKIPPSATPLKALDLGCPYDGHSRSPGLWIPAAILASRAGLPIVLHGYQDLPAKFGVGLIPLWKNLGLSVSRPENALSDLEKNSIVCLSQEDITPELARMAPIRRELGLRSLFNTVEKALNPMNVSHLAIGYFHETILPAMESMVRTAHPHAKVTFVGGQEGSIGLFTHRATKIVPVNSIPDLVPEFLPPVNEKVEPITVPPTTEAYTLYYHELIKNPLHPHRKALIWQAATLLMMGGLTSQMGEALSLIGDPGKGIDW
jgi:anthranilate phosphoribosyltransferase